MGRIRAANHLYALYSWKSDNPVGLKLRHVLVKCALRWDAKDVPDATGAPKSLCACGQRSGPEAQPPWLLLWGRLALGPHADMESGLGNNLREGCSPAEGSGDGGVVSPGK